MHTEPVILSAKARLERRPERPAVLPLLSGNVPAELTERPQWVCWGYQRRADRHGTYRWTKVPLRPDGRAASSTRPDSWASFAAACAALACGTGDGVGFVFTADDPFAGIDLDDCRDPATAALDPAAVRLLAELDSYSEVSPSGTGVKVFVRGRIDGGRRRDKVEAYDRGRYFAVTGQRVPDTPPGVHDRDAVLRRLLERLGEPLLTAPLPAGAPPPSAACDDDALLARAAAARNGDKFQRLWSGETSGYASASEADLALCRLLAFWCGPDPERIDRLFRRSGLYRVKWERVDYRRRTLAQALARSGEFISGEPGASAPGGNDRHSPPGADAPGSPAEGWEPPLPLAETGRVLPFPADVLPPPLAAFVSAAAAAHSCPADFAAVPLLVLAGTAIGASRCLALHATYSESPCLYAGVVGEPGSAKSPALELVARPVFRLQEARLDAWRRDRADLPDGTPPPPLPRLWCDDFTTEALAPLLAANPRGLAIVKDELVAWVRAMNQYRKGRGADRQFFLSCWSGKPILVDRKKQHDGPIFVPRPHLALVGCLPPAVLRQLAGGGDGGDADGFLDRLLLAWPEETPTAAWAAASVPADLQEAWAAAVARLYAVPLAAAPTPLPLDDEAAAEWKRHFDAHAAEMNGRDLAEGLRGPWSKLRGYAGRLALVLHLLHAAAPAAAGPVSAARVAGAWRLVAYFKSHTRRVYGALDSDAELARARLLLQWLRRERRQEFRPWEAFGDLKSRRHFRGPEDVEGPLARLCRYGYLRLRPAARAARPGRPDGRVYEVNPLALAAE